MLKRFRRKPPEPLTVEEAIEAGVIQYRPRIPKSGFYIRHWTVVQDELGRRHLTGDAVDVYYASWKLWRNDMRRVYYGMPSQLRYRDVPTGMREPMLDLSAGAPVENYNAGKGFLLDKGLVSGTDYVNRSEWHDHRFGED